MLEYVEVELGWKRVPICHSRLAFSNTRMFQPRRNAKWLFQVGRWARKHPGSRGMTLQRHSGVGIVVR
jgi:hypothetical protein